jgi:hypothetical protein
MGNQEVNYLVLQCGKRRWTFHSIIIVSIPVQKVKEVTERLSDDIS